MMFDFYIPVDENMKVVGFPVAGENLKQVLTDHDFSTPPEGWIPHEKVFQDPSTLPHRFYEYVVSESIVNGIHKEEHTFVEVKDPSKRKQMRDSFYQEPHASAAIFDEVVGAWMRPSTEQLNNMSGGTPNVVE